MTLLSNVANNTEAAGDETLVVVKRIVVSFKESFVAGLWNGEGTIPRNAATSLKGLANVFVFAGFREKRKNFKGELAHNLLAFQSGDALHFTIPNRVATLSIKREDAIETDIKEGAEKI
jgi:hypothetical protein